MRFKKGSRVEVLSKKVVPSGSWRCAEIINGNGHYYTVRYDGFLDASDETVMERISRKIIRPCPPLLEVSDNWIPGDVVEVLDNFSWKMATILKVLGKNYVLVRLLGSSHEFKISKFAIRLRQSWQVNKWIVIGKGTGSCEDGKDNEIFSFKDNQVSISKVQDSNNEASKNAKSNYVFENQVTGQNSFFTTSKIRKRGYSPEIEGCAGSGPKFRTVDKDDRLLRVSTANPSMPEQVGATAFSRNMLGEREIHASNKRTGLSEMDAEKIMSTGAFGCSVAENLHSAEADTFTCSVGSCSISSNNVFKSACHISMGAMEDLKEHYSDAESFCRSGYEDSDLILSKEDMAAEIHRLELHAYRCIMGALHASGPISWEQEALVTNLRLSLHISNDEHLMELRNLISSNNSISIR